MDNKMRDTFDKIHAEATLKQKTAAFLHEKIRQKSGSRKTVRLKLAAICASFVLIFIIGGFCNNLYFTPSAYVDIDVNPSIELMVNRFNRVIEASPYNDDGAAILQDINVLHMSYNAAVDKLIGAMVAKGYLKQDGTVSVTVQTSDGNRESNMLGNLQASINTALQTHHTDASSNVFAVNEEVRGYAHENHMTPAKYLAISELQQVDPTATFEDCREHTISEINQMIREHGSGHHVENPVDEDKAEQGHQPVDDWDEEENHSNSPTAPSNHTVPQNQHKNDNEHGGGHH